MKTKLLMILFLVLGIGVYSFILFGLSTEDYMMRARLFSIAAFQMMFFWIVLLYYSYSNGTPKKIIVITIVFSIAYVFIELGVINIIVWRLSDDFYKYYRLVAFSIRSFVMIYLVLLHYKYSRSLVFPVLLAFYVVGIGMSFAGLFGINFELPVSVVRGIVKNVVIILAIYYDSKIRKAENIKDPVID